MPSLRRSLLPAALVLLATASGAQARPLKAIWGPVTLPDGTSAGPLYKTLGVDNLQEVISWADVAPTKPAHPRDPSDPAYTWTGSTTIDQAVALGHRYGFSVSVVLHLTPGWANGGRTRNWAPTNAKTFGDFAYAASKRYPGVHRWMIWGEPSTASNFSPMPPGSPVGPRRYARVLDAAYGALKAASRRNIVIGGMTFTAGDVVPRDWISWMRLPNGKPPRLDLYGHNPFSTRAPDLKNPPSQGGYYDFGDLDTLHARLHRIYGKAYKRFRRSGPRIWISEFTIQADHGSPDFNYYVDQRTQGQWLAQAFRQIDHAPYIADMGWLGLLDEPVSSQSRTTGLLTYDLKPKPAYYAYKRAR